MFDRRLVQCFDWGLLAIIFLLALVGVLTLKSAVTAGADLSQKALWTKQIVWFGGGFFIMFVTFFFDYKILDRWGYLFYFLCILLLVFVLLFGKLAGGSKRWLLLGPISIQPSEIVKVAVIIMLARHYSRRLGPQGFNFRELLKPFIYVMIPFMLIVRQPDLGTAMLIFLIAASITVFVKVERRSFITIIVICLVVLSMGWFVLQDYQKQRIKTFLDPNRDPLGAGYHIIQSKIAIGSGMVWGKGYLKGTQNSLSFLPEQHTDFIFSVLAEEWGFSGAMAVLGLFMLLVFWGLNIAYQCRDPFGAILATGITIMVLWQVFINIGMVMGLMPVVGVPLPFISYGGSSVITIMVGMGLLMNVSMRRFMVQ